MGVADFERFFRAAGGLDVGKEDLKRLDDFVVDKLGDLLLVGQARAEANDHVVVEPQDLPVTKGLEECVHRFRAMDDPRVDIAKLEDLLDQIAVRRVVDRSLSEETQARLPELAGGLSYALAQSFTILDPTLRNPQTEHWDRAVQLFDLLL
jgi:hypothetical protein